MAQFKHLFEPIRIGPVEIPNRICHVPTDISSSHIDGSVSDRDIAHHATLARGGTGLIVVGATSPNGKTGRSTVTNLVIDNDNYIPGFARLAAGMHRYGAKCAVQLQHAGRQAALPRDGKLASNDVAVSLPWSQSHAIVYASADEKKKTVHVLTTDEVIEMVELFGEAAWRVQQAGFDAVELHAAHGYLLSQFMSPLPEQAHRPLRRLLREPHALPAGHRGLHPEASAARTSRSSSATRRTSGSPAGAELAESIEVAKRFEQAGVAALDLCQCIQESPGAGFDPM